MKLERRSPRVNRRVRIRYGDARTPHTGYTTNVSRGGFCLEGRRLFTPGTELWVQIGDSKRVYRGTVVWTRRTPTALIHAGYFHMMGISLELAREVRMRASLSAAA